MKFFVCVLLIPLACAHDHDHEPPPSPGLFDYYTMCCSVEGSRATNQYIDSILPTIEECRSELDEEDKRGPPKFACFHECLGNKTNVINADGSLNEDGFRSVVTTQMATEDYQKTAADGIATSCIAEVKAVDDSGDSPDGCSTIAMKAFHCASKGFLNACPTANQRTDEHCVHFREMINSDFKMMLPPSPMSTTSSSK